MATTVYQAITTHAIDLLDMPSSLVHRSETKPQSDMSETDGVSLPHPSKTRALMSRLQAFLPQMKEANQALTAENSVRLDLQLESDKDDDDNSKSDDSDDVDDEDGGSMSHGAVGGSKGDESSSLTHPTIQIQFAMGTVNENPVMKLLARSSSDDENDENSYTVSSNDAEDNSRKRALEDLLSTSKGEDDRSPKSPEKKMKPLITELS